MDREQTEIGSIGKLRALFVMLAVGVVSGLAIGAVFGLLMGVYFFIVDVKSGMDDLFFYPLAFASIGVVLALISFVKSYRIFDE